MTLSFVFLVSLVVTGQNVQINQKLEPSPLPDYFVLKNNPDTIFAKVGRQRYKLVNGRFIEVKIKTAKGKKTFTKTELEHIQSFRMNGYVAYRHAFDQVKKENLNVLTEGPFVLMRRIVFVEHETDEEIETVRTEVFYWWQAGKMIEVDAAAVAKVVQFLAAQCNISAESPGTSDKDGLFQLTNQLNQHCSTQSVW